MAHHKSAKKRIRTNERKRKVNQLILSKVKTLVKKVYSAENKEQAEVLMKEAVSAIDKSVSKGKIHRNTAARKKSAITRFVSEFAAGK